MYKKLDFIRRTPTNLAVNKIRPSFEFKEKGKDGGLTREQKLELKAGNKYFKQTLIKQSSFYSLFKLEKDYKRAQYIKRNICEYPCIDFYKTRSSFTRGSETNHNKGSKKLCFNFCNSQSKGSSAFGDSNCTILNKTKIKQIKPILGRELKIIKNKEERGGEGGEVEKNQDNKKEK